MSGYVSIRNDDAFMSVEEIRKCLSGYPPEQLIRSITFIGSLTQEAIDQFKAEGNPVKEPGRLMVIKVVEDA